MICQDSLPWLCIDLDFFSVSFYGFANAESRQRLYDVMLRVGISEESPWTSPASVAKRFASGI
jgi:hypothetical protein